MNGFIIFACVLLVGFLALVGLVIWALKQSSTTNSRLETQEELISAMDRNQQSMFGSIKESYGKLRQQVDEGGFGGEELYHVTRKIYGDMDQLGSKLEERAKISYDEINLIVQQNEMMRDALTEIQKHLRDSGASLAIDIPSTPLPKFTRPEPPENRPTYADTDHDEFPLDYSRRRRGQGYEARDEPDTRSRTRRTRR